MKFKRQKNSARIFSRMFASSTRNIRADHSNEAMAVALVMEASVDMAIVHLIVLTHMEVTVVDMEVTAILQPQAHQVVL